ncbi:MAG TPA: glycosyltransferase family 2 protein [Phycisphaerales bacterium]|nr:glycosyltransferase family 2 protein [Phycisphaerales bacterium]
MLLSVVILSFNRREALLRTLREIDSWRAKHDAEVIVVDNASNDGSVEAVRERAPWAKLIAQASNTGVAGFNAGAALATGEHLLILDDDSWPDPASLASALALLAQRASIAAVALVPKHPTTKSIEWPFVTRPTAKFTAMGCGNLVRTDAWRKVGGYEDRFFLYRNDTDLAMKLLGAGFDVYMDPAWIVWHDSPAAAIKSERWLHLATRNWIWLCRRHGATWRVKLLASVLGALTAFRHAGPTPSRLGKVIRGIMDGVDLAYPPLPPSVICTGEAMKEHLRMRWRKST